MPSAWIGSFALIASTALVLATGCAKQGSTAGTSRVEQQRFALRPASVSVAIGPLAGQLTDLEVHRAMNLDSHKVTDPPTLLGTLKIRNTATDVSARLVSGTIAYGDAAGRPIALAATRNNRFKFPSYAERLDPGGETSQRIEVAFPASAIDAGTLARVTVQLVYIETPYRNESATVPLALGTRAGS